MIDGGKKNVLGVLVNSVDYDGALSSILAAAKASEPFGVTALAVHGVVTGLLDRTQRHRVNKLDLVTPDGQPVRWVLNFAYSAGLSDRVYGPTLMLRVCEAAARERLPVFFYGSRAPVVNSLAQRMSARFPGLTVAGAEASQFRPLSLDEKRALVDRIRSSGARIVFVGLGCPRQEVFAYEFRNELRMPLIAVGAGFDYHSGFTREPPQWIQDSGLQWLHRLACEPRRLWRRYLFVNTIYIAGIALQLCGLLRVDAGDTIRPEGDLRYG
jgi:N-acetylglucosaminyldiphosphoundecaprenol N-acetyl-beta-D-mannosaminyltransferase